MYKSKLTIEEISKSQNLRFGAGYSKLCESLFFKRFFSECPLRLKDICTITKGDSITADECEPGIIPVVAGGKSFAYYHSESNRQAGIITASASGAYSGFINYWDVDIWASDCSTIRSKDEAQNSTKFWFYLLRLIQPDLYHLQTGAGQPHVYPQDLQYIRIPHIPIEYQKQILKQIRPIEKSLNKLKENVLPTQTILDKVFEEEAHANIQLRQGMTYGTQRQKNSTFNRFSIAFTDFANHKGLRLSARASSPIFEELEQILLETGYKHIEDIVLEPVHNGATPTYNEAGEIYVIKTANITNEGISLDNAEFVNSEQLSSNPKAQIKKGDIVVCNIGKGSLGKVDYCEQDNTMFAANETMIIRVNPAKYYPKFLCYFLRSIFGVYQFEREYTGTTNQIHIDPASVSRFLIPNISMTEQKRIVKIYEDEIKKNERIKNKVNKLEDSIAIHIKDSLKRYGIK